MIPDRTDENGLVLPVSLLNGKVSWEGNGSVPAVTPEVVDGYVVISLAAVMAGQQEAIEWVWGGRGDDDGRDKGLIPEGKVTFLGGASAEGKSTLAFHLVSHMVSDGKPLLGQPVGALNRALILTETDEDQVRRVFTDAQVTYPDRVRLIFTGLTIVQLEVEIAKFMPDVLVVDSLTAFADDLKAHGPHRFDWNGSSDGTALVRAFRDLRRKYDLKAVILLVHTNKPGKDEKGQRVRGARPHIADIRGSGGIVEQCDLGFIMQPSRDGNLGNVWTVKARNRGAILEHLKFSYSDDTGQFEHVASELTQDAVVEAVGMGYVSRDSLAKHLHFRRERVGEMVNTLLGMGKLTETGTGKHTKLGIPGQHTV